jgi:hypothetical protein
MNNVEILVLAVVILFALYVIVPSFYTGGDTQCPSDNSSESNEQFTALQQMDNTDNVSGTDPDASTDGSLTPKGQSTNFESLIYDNVTGTIMTGSQFMENTGLVAPPWVAPAWNPDAYGPSSKGELDVADYENDPRMLYNKCSLSCCSPQYPTPFQGDKDPFVCDKDGNNKYLASNYICQNNTGGTGCLCMTPKQVKGMENGFVDYYVDKKNLGY